MIDLETIKARRKAFDTVDDCQCEPWEHECDCKSCKATKEFWNNIEDDEAWLLAEVERLEGERDAARALVESNWAEVERLQKENKEANDLAEEWQKASIRSGHRLSQMLGEVVKHKQEVKRLEGELGKFHECIPGTYTNPNEFGCDLARESMCDEPTDANISTRHVPKVYHKEEQ